MSYNNYIIFLCFLFVACKNEANVANQTTTTNDTPREEVKTIVSEPEPIAEPKVIKIDTVTVSNLVDLVDNAKSNTVLILEKGTYKLEKDLVYLMSKDERVIIDKNVVETRSIGGQLHFSGLSNFQIIGKKGAVVVSDNPNAVVLFLLKCKNVKVANLTVKKNIVGKVDLCYVAGSQDVKIDNCKFAGGGTYGIYSHGVENLTVSNCLITKCTTGAIKILDSQGLKYVNTTITNNFTTVPLVTFYGSKSIATFSGVNIVNNKRNSKSAFEGSERIFNLGINIIRLDNCVVRDNEGFTNLGVGPNFLNRTEIHGVAMQ
jgi:hypothetical protein